MWSFKVLKFNKSETVFNVIENYVEKNLLYGILDLDESDNM